jgi:hypothetical protein
MPAYFKIIRGGVSGYFKIIRGDEFNRNEIIYYVHCSRELCIGIQGAPSLLGSDHGGLAARNV